MAPEPLSKGVWWNTPSGPLLPQVARVDYALDLAQPRNTRSTRFGPHPRDIGFLPVSILSRHTPSSSLRSIGALAETYPSPRPPGEARRVGKPSSCRATTPAPLYARRVPRAPGHQAADPGGLGFYRRKESIERHHRRDVG